MRSNKEIIAIIKSLLDESGKKAVDMAKALGVGRSAMSLYLNGKRGFPLKKVDAAADFLGTTPGYILGLDLRKEPTCRRVNFIDAAVSAGTPSNVDPFTSQDLKLASISQNLLGKYAEAKNLLMMKVNGESMNRILPDGSIIGVQKVESLSDFSNGNIVVFSNLGDFYVKRIYINSKLKLVDFLPDSTDKSFQPISYLFSNMDNIKILGKVVFHTIFD